MSLNSIKILYHNIKLKENNVQFITNDKDNEKNQTQIYFLYLLD